MENLSSRVSWQELKDELRRGGDVTFAEAHTVSSFLFNLVHIRGSFYFYIKFYRLRIGLLGPLHLEILRPSYNKLFDIFYLFLSHVLFIKITF